MGSERKNQVIKLIFSIFYPFLPCNSLKIEAKNKIKKRKKGLESLKKERKRLRTSGSEYNSRIGKTIKTKTCPATIVSKTDISVELKTILFMDYYKIANHNQQSRYLFGLIKVVNVQKRRDGVYENPEDSRRQCITLSLTEKGIIFRYADEFYPTFFICRLKGYKF